MATSPNPPTNPFRHDPLVVAMFGIWAVMLLGAVAFVAA